MTRMVKARILVAVDQRGEWSALGMSGADDRDIHGDIFLDALDMECKYWVEVMVPVPETLKGSVIGESED